MTYFDLKIAVKAWNSTPGGIQCYILSFYTDLSETQRSSSFHFEISVIVCFWHNFRPILVICGHIVPFFSPGDIIFLTRISYKHYLQRYQGNMTACCHLIHDFWLLIEFDLIFFWKRGILRGTYVKTAVGTRNFTILQNVFLKVSRYVIWKHLSFSWVRFGDTPYYSPPLLAGF